MRAIPVLLTLAVALMARTAAADDLNLAWRAPAGCPSAKEVHDAALRTASTAKREPLDADVRVDHTDRWTVTIRTTRAGVPSADRRLEATTCTGVADATAVILALALIPPAADPVTVSSTAPPLDVPVPVPVPDSSAPAPAAAPSAVTTPAPAADSDRPRPDPSTRSPSPYAHGLATSASLATDSTTLPSAALGARASLALTPSRSRARIELSGSYFASQSKTTSTSPAGADFTLLVAGARGCWAFVRADVELSPCAGVDYQSVRARGFGASNNYDASAAWISAAGGGLVRVPVASWLALRADADAIVPLSRPRFVVEGDGAVHRPASFGVRAGIGAELLFL